VKVPGERNVFMEVNKKDNGAIEVVPGKVFIFDERTKVYTPYSLYGDGTKTRGLNKFDNFVLKKSTLVHSGVVTDFDTTSSLAAYYGGDGVRADELRQKVEAMNIVARNGEHMAVCCGGKAYTRQTTKDERRTDTDPNPAKRVGSVEVSNYRSAVADEEKRWVARIKPGLAPARSP
jgi:hypothetical protein